MTRRGFTLMELLIAAVMSAILLSALQVVFRSAVRISENTGEMLDARRPIDSLWRPIRLDLENALAPGGLLAGALIGQKEDHSGRRRDTLELYTTTARISDSSPWAETCMVQYGLEEMDSASTGSGMALVRNETRNLLPSDEAEVESTVMIEGVDSLSFDYFDGEEWQDAWDATTAETVMPTAISVEIRFVEPQAGERLRAPLSWVFEVVAKSTATPTPTSEGGQP